ncbi:aspartate carbamoyltransferase, partial [bacterium]|nr:aspartate carbamoyltransferase [bacterium]
QKERMSANFFPDLKEYSRYYGMNGERLKRTKPGAIIMHPGPMNRGVEITTEVAESDQSVILEQVTNGIAVRMALLYLLIGARDASEKKTETTAVGDTPSLF